MYIYSGARGNYLSRGARDGEMRGKNCLRAGARRDFFVSGYRRGCWRGR